MKRLLLLSLLLPSPGNAQWERVTDIPASRWVYSLLAVQDTLYVGTDSLVFVGTSAGANWSAGAPPVATPNAISCMLKRNDALLAGTIHHGIFRSTNDGRSWQPVNAGLSGLGATDVSSLSVRRDSVIAGTLGAGVFTTSSDFSQPWTRWGDSISNYQGDNVFRMASIGNTVLAAAGANGYMFRFTDNQPWWNPIPINTPRLVGQIVWSIARGTSAVFTGTSSGIYRSSDEGLSWELTSAPLPAVTFAILMVVHDGALFALECGTTSSVLLRSGDDGLTWTAIGSFPMTNVLDIAIAGETFYIAHPTSLWRAPLSRLVTAVEQPEATPSSFDLLQNYPNPFNPSTNIRYTLPTSSFVRLQVIDVSGRIVADLVDEEQDAGVHQAAFSGKNLSSGVYYYRLTAGGYSGVRPMILMK